MRILGVDPSLHATGYGVVDCHAGTLQLIEGGTIEPGDGRDLGDRLAELQRGVGEVIAAFHPEVMVIEEVFARGAHPRTAILMAHARGALMCAAGLAGMPVVDYAATAVKRALVGNGAAAKEQVERMVWQLLGLRRRTVRHDLTDALALAITHGLRAAGPQLLAR